jgi:RHS repeat-associated protein
MEKFSSTLNTTKRGELIRIIDEKEKIFIDREVDPFGNVTREVFSNRIDIKKSYDAFDRPLKFQITDIGSISYTYNPLYLRSISRASKDGKLQYSLLFENYDLDGNLLSENMVNSAGRIQNHLDLKGRKTEIVSPYFSQKCFYDAADNLIKSIIDKKPVVYSYDALSQLSGEDAITYAYDSLLNRRLKNGEQFEINNLNELKELTYDLNGNQIQKDNVHYVYDPLNRLVEANYDKKKICFQYDPLGRRLAKIVMEMTVSEKWRENYRENYLYDGKHEIGALRGDGSLKNFRTLAILSKPVPTLEEIKTELNDEIESLQTTKQIQNDKCAIELAIPITVAVELNQKIYAAVTDAHRNICRLVDPLAKKIVSHYDFTAFGEEGKNQVDENPWRYAAKRFDPELNLVYFGKRYYDPELGRWLSIDPAGFADSLNLYQYVLNNPFRYCDPDGDIVFLALAIPFAQLVCGAAVSAAVIEAVVDAVIAGALAYAAWEGSKYVSNAIEKRSNQDVRGSHHSNVREGNREVHEDSLGRRQREQRKANEKRQKIKNKQNKGKK